MWKFSESSLEHRGGVDRRLIQVSDLALELSPIDFGIPELGGVRSEIDQNLLYLDGKSKLDGFNKISRHQSGLALDFYAYVDGQASWDHHHLAVVAGAHLQAASMLEVRLAWGGLWRHFPDYPHIELIT